MHTATQLTASMFAVEIEGRAADLNALLPEWQAHDRFAIIVRGPLASVGASLLIQAAITRFYDWRRLSGRRLNVYPEMFLFHVGGRWGDHSTLDFWPPRKEVFLADDPGEILGALNDYAITRLAIPDGMFAAPPCNWVDEAKERNAAADRMTSIFRYDAGGNVADSDVRITATGPVTEENINAILQPESVLQAWSSAESKALSTAQLRPYLQAIRERLDEVPAPIRQEISAQRRSILAAKERSETFGRIRMPEALRRLAG